MVEKCIYCNATDDLSVSDIIPETLTNAKITKKNVCRVRHNNDFGESFESDVISKLVFLRNHLDISNKKKKQAEYKVTVEIDGVEYERQIKNVLDLFNGNPYKSLSGNYLFGDFEKLKELAERKGKEIKEINLNNMEIQLKVGFSFEIFYSQSMQRLVAKMAYEWLCYVNDINEKHEEFSDVINFIEKGGDNNCITYISDNDLYYDFSKTCESGSHCFLSFRNNKNQLQVLVSFFGVCLFKANFGGKAITKIKKEFVFHELQVTTKQVVFKHKDFKEFMDHIHNNIVFIVSDIVKTPFSLGLSPQEFEYGFGILGIMGKINNDVYTSEVDEKLVRIVLENFRELMHTSIIHIRKLKRFVAEHYPNLTEVKKINPKGSSYDIYFLYYILYLIGKNSETSIDSDSIFSLISENIGEKGPYILNSSFTKEIVNSMLTDVSCPTLMLIGAKLVAEAPYD
ncbi:hypothetical protein CSV80_11105 [Sporosarcina sp. P12(2017)]|uniref:hypothetical protein n=1 Tax=unclassified Sporosarcina TaxID=2647733 RepID=UPI000C17225A|nr:MULTISPECIES: hypothetical protein [unclassified Sporosarcina]PIC57008.1 hypothetical protein CSV81_11505 [Sporosarcina sp. P10]PIC60391.1 hypothetical protein CSV80_11105 [Sporosarcina sp. P12(2017)]